MIDKNTVVTVVNKFGGTVSYKVPEMGIQRHFYPSESKEITYEELEKLSFSPGGKVLLKEYLEITDEEVAKSIFNKDSEPEYHYSKEDVKQLLISGSLDQFLDCLDFAPDAIKDMVKDLAVDLPLNDMAKRQAIQEKLNFDVTKAIEIKNTKFDGEAEAADSSTATGRRAAPMSSNVTTAPSGRRYKPITKQ